MGYNISVKTGGMWRTMENDQKNNTGDSSGSPNKNPGDPGESPNKNETRKEPRIKKFFKIKIKDEETIYPAAITSMSKTGMSIKTAHVLPTYKIIEIMVKINDKIIPLNGSVRWVWEPSDKDSVQPTKRDNEIGIALQNPPPEYLAHFDNHTENKSRLNQLNQLNQLKQEEIQ